MAKVHAVPLPQDSRILKGFGEAHYQDAYARLLPAGHFADARAAARAVFRGAAWMDALMALRDLLVRPFGLRPGAGVKGRELPFTVLHEDAREVVMGEADSHLVFRASVHLEEGPEGQRLTVATLVHFHNRLGRLYFVPVKPFHRRIVMSSLRRA
jgi:hypothetical protein